MKSKILSILVIFVMSTASLFAQVEEHNPFDYVDPFIGTGGEGHTYPGSTLPFGMVQLSPDTYMPPFQGGFKWCAGYQYDDGSIMGFSHTHFSGTGHSDLGDVLIMPTTGELKTEPGALDDPDSGWRSRFDHDQEEARPGYYSVVLKDYNIKAELTTTQHAGMHRYNFPKDADVNRITLDLISSIYNYDGKVLMSSIRVENDTLITGYRQTKGWAPNRFIFFAIRLSKPIKDFKIVDGEKYPYNGFGYKGPDWGNYPEVIGKKLRAYFEFETDNEPLLMKVGISAVDIEGAKNNVDTEINHWDFDKVVADAKAIWTKALERVKINADKSTRTIFYTSIYHTLLAPIEYQDVDGRYRGADLGIHQSTDFTNHTIYSLWDTYRALHPLFTLTQPEHVGDMISSMVNHAEQNAHGMLPIWSFHGNESWCMIGYHAVSVIADAYMKGIEGFDAEAAFEAAKHTATYGPFAGLDSYMQYGYVPIDKEHEGASKTLEYAYDDWAIARMAEKMGKNEDAKHFYERAEYFKNIFDSESGFMRAKKVDGSFREPFDPFYARYGGDYTEGNAYQYSWYVPQDPAWLVKNLGGDKKFVERLDELFALEQTEDSYKHVEDIAGLIGQYAHGNEPSQHIAYLYNWAGAPWKTQFRIDQVMNHLFDDTPYGICGNEDCGQMSAWYVFSSMGFYPVAPGSNEYIIGTPRVDYATIDLQNGKSFSVEAKNLSAKNIYIQKATLNGKTYDKSFIRHEDIVDGAKLVFEMGPKPNKKWGKSKASRPYSLMNK